MNTKLMTSVGCLLLAAAAIAPTVVVGHSERTAIGGDLSGYGAGARVSGRYVGSAGPAVAVDAYNNPQDTLATGGMLCDAEVVIDDDTAPGNSGNEPLVDGVFGGTSPNGEFWDDGGNGGACHTHHYTTTLFNTLNCYSGVKANAGTHTGADVWIGASCDWKEDQGGTSSETTLVLCLVNAALAFNPLAILGNNPPLTTPDLVAFAIEVQAFVNCVFAYRDCVVDPTCGPDGATQICGADSFSDAINYGYGGLGVAGSTAPALFPTNTGIVNPAPGVTGPCADGPAAVFVFDTVATNGPGPVPTVEVYPALTGEIWS